jgi:ABC-type branched-subunit amino acid transport system substrate-binding protein
MPKRVERRPLLALALAAPLIARNARARADRRYDQGVSDTEIKLGTTSPYSGPASSFGAYGVAQAAYFAMLNEQGGINGRKITLVQLDDGYSPPRTVEQTRRLVEQEKVAFIFAQLGTPTGMSTRRYLNDHKVPDVFVASGATQFFDHEHFPWVIGWQPSYQIEGRVYAKHLLATKPDAKIAVLAQNDDSGRDATKGLRDGLGERAERMIVSTATYETTDATTDSQVLTAQGSGADVFFFWGIPKFSAMTIRKVYDVGWKPTYIVGNPASSVATALQPAGLEKSVGLITSAYMKDPNDPQWKDDPAMLEWRAFMGRHFRDGDPKDGGNLYAYLVAQVMVHVLKQCGDDLTRANLMRQAANLKALRLPLLLPGMTVDTSPTDFYPIEAGQLARFNGTQWEGFGEVIQAAKV